jgi:hypothetical protein
VLVVDETGCLKKGTHSVGVARQYSGTAGRVENCQVGVFVAYASRWGQALIDRRLSLPEAWAGDAARRQRAAVPETVAFATKPAIAAELIAAALDAGAPCAWVLADALYGADSRIRRMLETRGQPYVLATRSNHHLRLLTRDGLVQTDPATLADAMPATAWTPHAAGEGLKGGTALRLGAHRLALDHRCRLRALAADPPQPTRPRRARLLPGLRAGRHRARRTGRRGGAALDHRGMLPARQGGTRPRPLRGKVLARLAPAHDALHGGRRLPRRVAGDTAPRCVQQTEQKESGARRLNGARLGLPSVPEIRTLLARLLLRSPVRRVTVLAWSAWRRRHQQRAAKAHRREHQMQL